MSNDPRAYQAPSEQQSQYQPGPFDPTVPMSPSPYAQPMNQQGPNSGPNQGPSSPVKSAALFAQLPRRDYIVAGIAIVAIVVIVIAAGLIGAQFNTYSRVVSSYYGTVKQQDYAKAYTYISLPGAFNQQGVRLYTAIASGLDKANGPVTSYSEQSESRSGNNAVVVEMVERQSHSYTVQITLTKINEEWKIVSYSNI